MSPIPLLGVLTLVAWAQMEAAAATPVNMCVACHQTEATLRAVPVWSHDRFLHWYGTVHAAKGVTCERCHGGVATADTKVAAHVGVESSMDAGSALSARNAPQLCGTCHDGVYKEFVESGHYKQLMEDRLAPTCTTCHGHQMDLGALTPLQMAGRCMLCHNADTGLKPEVVDLSRRSLEQLRTTRLALARARATVEQAQAQDVDTAGAAQLLRAAEERLTAAGQHWHRFRVQEFQGQLAQITAMADNAYVTASWQMVRK